MKGTKLLIVGAGCLISAVIIWILLKALRTSMIVEFGIVATNAVRTVLLGVFVAAGLVAVAIGLYQRVTDTIKNSSEDRIRKSNLAYRAKTSGVKEIREQLMILKSARPRLSGKIGKGLDQLDDMASQFARFDQLIKINDAEAVKGAMVGLKEIEGTLCTNLNFIISSVIATDDDETPETNAFYDKSADRIDEVLAANSRVLGKGNELLQEIAANVSQPEAGGDTTLSDAWIDSIRSQKQTRMEEPK